MEKVYDYYKTVRKDILNNLGNYDSFTDFNNYDEYYKYVYDKLYVDDGVTGKGSGRYFSDIDKTEEALYYNSDLLERANKKFGYTYETTRNKSLNELYEWYDVIIRCYILGDVLGDILEEEGIFEYFKNRSNE